MASFVSFLIWILSTLGLVDNAPQIEEIFVFQAAAIDAEEPEEEELEEAPAPPGVLDQNSLFEDPRPIAKIDNGI